MTSHWHYVLVYEKYDGGMTYLCDNSPLKIVSCGRVVIRFHDGRVKGIDEVLHILGLAQSVLVSKHTQWCGCVGCFL